jgi:hypothetical protein
MSCELSAVSQGAKIIHQYKIANIEIVERPTCCPTHRVPKSSTNTKYPILRSPSPLSSNCVSTKFSTTRAGCCPCKDNGEGYWLMQGARKSSSHQNNSATQNIPTDKQRISYWFSRQRIPSPNDQREIRAKSLNGSYLGRKVSTGTVLFCRSWVSE